MRLNRCRFALIALVITSSAALASRANVAASGSADPKVRTVEIIATDDMKYSVNRIAASRGEQLRIRLTSKGTIPKIAMAHNVVVLKLGTNELKFITAGAPNRASDFIASEMKDRVLAATPLAGPGEVVEVTFKVPSTTGTYPFVCTFPGHFQAGMKGTLVVK